MNRGKAHKVQMQLLTEAKRLGVLHDLVLRRYAFERFLARLGDSRHRLAFVLKGAMALVAVTGAFNRPTRDMDMLGIKPMSVEETLEALRAVAALEPLEDDAVRFDPTSFKAEIINATSDEPGTRVSGYAYIGSMRIPLKIEVSHGQVVTPRPMEMSYPTLLDDAAPANILCYTPETMLAEKFEAMCTLGIHTSRFKDFYDIRELSRRIDFDGDVAAEAIRRTFERRGSALPKEVPVALTEAFHERGERGWRGFLRKQGIDDSSPFADAAEEIRGFVMPLAAAALSGAPAGSWKADGGWSTSASGMRP